MSRSLLFPIYRTHLGVFIVDSCAVTCDNLVATPTTTVDGEFWRAALVTLHRLSLEWRKNAIRNLYRWKKARVRGRENNHALHVPLSVGQIYGLSPCQPTRTCSRVLSMSQAIINWLESNADSPQGSLFRAEYYR